MQTARVVSEAEALAQARAFAEALAGSPEFRAFEAARERLAADRDAATLLRRLQDTQQRVALVQTWGGVATHELAEMERLTAEALQHPVVRAVFEAQAALRELLRDAAGVISAEVGIDFGAACNPAGGCC